MALALYHRQKTGRGQHVMTALVETATYHAARYLVEYEGKVSDEPRGPMALGEGPLQRLYKGNDEWFFLGATPGQRKTLASIVGLDGIDAFDDAALEQALEERFALKPAKTWITELTAADIGASTLGRVKDLMLDPWAEAHNLSVTQDVEGVGRMTMPGVAPRLSGTPIRVGDPVRPPGADGPMLLNRFGMEENLDRLVEAGVMRLPATPSVSEGPPK